MDCKSEVAEMDNKPHVNQCHFYNITVKIKEINVSFDSMVLFSVIVICSDIFKLLLVYIKLEYISTGIY